MTPPVEGGTGGLSRRRLLAAMTAVGATGGFVGASTGASLSDRERQRGSLTAGVVDLAVTATDEAGDPLSVVDGAVSIPMHVDPGESGAAVVDLALPGDANNPAYLWLRTACPEPAGTALAEALTVTLSYLDDEGTATDLVTGPFREVFSTLRNGYALNAAGAYAAPGFQECLDPDDGLRLRLAWTLSPTYVGTETATADIEFVARQCRNTDAATDPFAGAPAEPCAPGNRCEGCEWLGKLDLDPSETDQPGIGDSSIESGRTYQFNEGATDYGITVDDTVEKDGDTTAVRFTVVGPDGATLAPCRVEVKGGPADTVYVRPDGAAFDASTDGLVPGDDGNGDELVDGGLLYAPLTPGGSRAGVSHVDVFVCVAAGGEN
jgi:hypothetical protein